jgi:hypothetical protein
VDEPELLLYEPEKNGRLRLVAVEYIILYTLHSRASAPPVRACHVRFHEGPLTKFTT